MLTSNISLKNFGLKTKNSKIKQSLQLLFSNKTEVIKSMTKNYKDSFEKKDLKNTKK